MNISFENGFKGDKVLIKVSYSRNKDKIEEFKNKGYRCINDNEKHATFKVSRKVFLGGL